MSQSHSPSPKHQCPICKWEVPHLVTHFQQDLDGPLLDFLLTQHKTWDISQGVCTSCLNDLQEHLQSKLLHVHEKEHDGFAVLPTPLRMQAHSEYRGKGGTICLIGSAPIQLVPFYVRLDGGRYHQARAHRACHLDCCTDCVDYETATIIFQYHNHTAQNVALTGDFLEWKAKQTLMDQTEPGIWLVAVPILSKGMYQYKYLVDEQYWHTDPANFYRQPDGFDGFNSVFFI